MISFENLHIEFIKKVSTVYACLACSLIPDESSKCTRVLHTPSSQRKAPSVHVSYILPHPRGKLQVYTCLAYSLIPEESSKCTNMTLFLRCGVKPYKRRVR